MVLKRPKKKAGGQQKKRGPAGSGLPPVQLRDDEMELDSDEESQITKVLPHCPTFPCFLLMLFLLRQD